MQVLRSAKCGCSKGEQVNGNVNGFTTILGSLPHSTFVLGIDKGANVYYFASNPSRVNALDPRKS
ncbi:hypothetical protein WN48_08633 [Eufriesea mexicana]|nr:hypothetical protein WN48_08633 [Eufriesea mexicana]